ncbi:hypothetical protein PG2T_13070 [Immundisolibacter cernigliae]|uniref:Uncharacterized protein n=1 Tax=Immundisolibacter cernigliae TaxID=1810504 RepID=A0A1B1YW89_9GAMM|nr:hypothetical protein [Immundisolibacter cernigliae]ANX05012.1 hypothetical protein PG2T_13070 [Immundisolibacter cernigliae]
MEVVLHVHQQQFLVLLLVVEAQFQQRRQARPARWVQRVQQGCQVPIHMRPVGEHFVGGGPGQQAAPRARVKWPDLVVVGIEQIAIAGMKRAISRQVWRQEEGLEKPARMR